MTFLFGSQKVPKVEDVPAPSILTNADDNAIKDAEEKKLRKGRTSRQTLLTGPQGLLEAAPVAKKTLLGE